MSCPQHPQLRARSWALLVFFLAVLPFVSIRFRLKHTLYWRLAKSSGEHKQGEMDKVCVLIFAICPFWVGDMQKYMFFLCCCFHKFVGIC